MKPKKELIRIVKSPEGEISLDFTGKKAGRGASICKSTECFKKVRKSRHIEKDFSSAISDELYKEMENELSEQNC